MFKLSLMSFLVAICITFANGDCVHGNVTLRTGEEYSLPGKCMEMKCESDDGTFFVKGCSIMTPNPELDCDYIPIDFLKPYPECCDWFNCTDRKIIDIKADI